MPKTNTISRTACKRLIHELLFLGHLGIEHVAQKSGISLRTLQRRLHDAGYTYSQLVDEVRHDVACRMLKKHELGIAEIATALGYADPSNFSRAFQRWSGLSPSEYCELHADHRGKRRNH